MTIPDDSLGCAMSLSLVFQSGSDLQERTFLGSIFDLKATTERAGNMAYIT